MKTTLKLTAIIIFFCMTGCRNRTGFVNHEKWKIPEAPGQGFLKSNPKEVKESYFDANDTTLFSEGLMNSIKSYRFDREGNIFEGYAVIDSIMYGEFFYNYSKAGEEYKFYSYTSKAKDSLVGTMHKISTNVSPNRFVVSVFHDSIKRYEEHCFFSEDYVEIERVFTPKEKILSKYWYRDDRLTKIVKVRGAIQNSELYFYDNNGYLDSINYKTKADSSPTERSLSKDIFFNNLYGDPVVSYTVADGDAFNFEKNTYLYDKNGNWIRRLTYAPDDRSRFLRTNSKFPLYSLSVREIVY